ncbi:MAG: phosphatase PAP2 family protein [Elusimicrobiales bacterium]|nr:phosphatase PAP2 family protein [Elusimicrobiales bacterium]
MTAFFTLARFPRLCAAGLALCLLACAALCQRCRAAEQHGFVKETLAAAGTVITSPARLDRGAAWWTGGLAAGGLLVYSADGQLRRLAGKNRSALNDSLADKLEKFGNGTYELGLLGVYGGLCYLFDGREGLRTSALALQSFLAANAAGTLVKYSAGRARPYAEDGKRRFTPFRFKSARTSFPSGHTTSAFAVASVFSRRCASPAVGISAYALAAGTALQRVYDDKHWASDVFAGAALGTAVGRWIASPARGKSPSAMLLPVYSRGYSGAAAVFAF